jgi:hypothetical protein
LEDQGSKGAKVMIDNGGTLSQLTTLTVYQFETPENYLTDVPVAIGETNTGQTFILF